MSQKYTSDFKKTIIRLHLEEGRTMKSITSGYPYDNAPMERYFNTLKSELIYQHNYFTEDALYKAIESYAYIEYNTQRPHTFNGGKTPFQARYCA